MAAIRPWISGVGFRGAAASGSAQLVERMSGTAMPPPLTRRSHPIAGEWQVAALPDDALALPKAMPEDVAARARRATRRAPGAAIAALNAAAEAWSMSGLPWVGGDRSRFAIVTTGGGTAFMAGETERLLAGGLPSAYTVSHGLDSFVLSLASELVGLHGEGMVAGAAQASGHAAIAAAARLIGSGEADAVMVLGVPQGLCPAEVAGYRAVGALAGDDNAGGISCRPFDRSSSGFLPAEIAAALVLEHPDVGRRRGAVPLTSLAGWALRLHASSQPTPDRAAEAALMRAALAHAGMEPGAVDVVSAHATGTAQGDSAEAGAIADVLGHGPLVLAPKGLVGHGLGSAGAAETVMAVLAMQARIVHGNVGITSPVLDGLWLAGDEGRAMGVGTVLKTGFGFGGINAALVLAGANG
jgi:3-oxoacyl-(acyl-carrier-protein) synthase